MEINQIKSIIEATLFAAGRPVTIKELILNLEISEEDIESIITSMQEDYKEQVRRNRINKNQSILSVMYQKRITWLYLPCIR